jgi:O-antigen biosynthesis protein
MKPSDSKPLGLDLSSLRADEYGEYAREPLFDLVDRPFGRVLDIGCARGAGASAMKDRGARQLVGLEIDTAYAEAAREHYDEVMAGSAEDDLPWTPGSFDTVLCYDVLEHTYDPWSILGRVRALLKPDGRLHISLPNSRNIGFWRPLLLRGTFGYEPSGLRDVTHIRFFTRRDLTAMVEAAGYNILRIDPTGEMSSRKRRFAVAATAGRAVELFAYQWVVLARPIPR